MSVDASPRAKLVKVCQFGDLERTALLLDEFSASGYNPNTIHDQTQSLLDIAAEQGDAPMIQLLCHKGLRQVNRALHTAVKNRKVDVVAALLSTDGIDVNWKDAGGDTALYLASMYGDIAIVQMLLSAGADVKCMNHGKETPLYVAAQGCHLKVVQILLDAGAKVRQADEDNYSPLFVAAWKGHAEMVSMMIHAGSVVNRLNDDDETALDIALEEGHRDVGKILRAAGAIYKDDAESV